MLPLGASPLGASAAPPRNAMVSFAFATPGVPWNVHKRGCFELNRELVGLGTPDRLAHLPFDINLVEAHSPDAHKVRPVAERIEKTLNA